MGSLVDRLDIAVSRALERLRLPNPCLALPRTGWWSLLDRWRPPYVYGEDHRGEMGARMCAPCRHRWLVGRDIRHHECAARLRHAIDEHFERLHPPA